MMHVPKQFKITDQNVIEEFIRENGFATLISMGSEYPVGTHIPIELEKSASGTPVLRGHLAKVNPHAELLAKNPNALVIFLSPIHSYISSSWYHHPNAPTWNYMSVHVRGKVTVIEGEALWNSVKRLTDRYEKHSQHPVSLETLPESVQRQIHGIVGFEITMEQVDAAFKLSQNRDDEDYANIINQLKMSNVGRALLLADIMKQMRGG